MARCATCGWSGTHGYLDKGIALRYDGKQIDLNTFDGTTFSGKCKVEEYERQSLDIMGITILMKDGTSVFVDKCNVAWIAEQKKE